MTTLVETPDAQLFRASVSKNVLTINDSREGYHAWRVDSMNGEFNAVEGYVRLAGKSKTLLRDPDWQRGANDYEFTLSSDDPSLVITIDQDMPTEVMFMLDSVNSPQVINCE